MHDKGGRHDLFGVPSPSLRGASAPSLLWSSGPAASRAPDQGRLLPFPPRPPSHPRRPTPNADRRRTNFQAPHPQKTPNQGLPPRWKIRDFPPGATARFIGQGESETNKLKSSRGRKTAPTATLRLVSRMVAWRDRARDPFLWDATNKSARFTSGLVCRTGFWRNWGVWGDLSPRSVIQGGTSHGNVLYRD